MVWLRNYRKAASSVTLQMATLSRAGSDQTRLQITAKPPYRRSTNTGWSLCLRSHCGVCVCVGGGVGKSPAIIPDLQHKSDIVAPNDPSKETVLPVQLDPEFSTSCRLPRTDGPILTSAAAQQSQQPSTILKHSYLWRSLLWPRSRKNFRHKAFTWYMVHSTPKI